MLRAVAVLLMVRSASSAMGRISGGHAVEIEDRPYQVGLEDSGELICGGSIISANTLVTAAHCLMWRQTNHLSVRAGSPTALDGGFSFEVATAVSHPKFDQQRPQYDIAIITIRGSFTFDDQIQPVRLATVVPTPGTAVTVSGWGLQSKDGTRPDQLQSLSMQIIDPQICDTLVDGKGNITGNHLCAVAPGEGATPCPLDDGGPVTDDASGELVGVVVGEPECGAAGKPVLFMNVPVMRNDSSIWPHM